ncbi:MAG TPA: helix-turn-helix transcriptional regulator [Herpetosiphonaceae bacterium]
MNDPKRDAKLAGFAKNLEAEIDRRGWNKSDFARRLNVQASQVTRWLSGHFEPELRTLYAMAQVFARHDRDPMHGVDEPSPDAVARWLDRLFRWYAEDKGLPPTASTVMTELVDASPAIVQVIEALAAIPPADLRAVAQQVERLQSHRKQHDGSK